jgi:tetratricopeptide (TPR) repeat protein
MAALISAWVWNQRPSTPQPPPLTTSTERATDAGTRNIIDLAAASVRAGNYRAALQYSEDALKRAPDDIEAARIRQEARAALDRFDEALGTARRLFALGDLDGASAAVAVASTLDNRSAAVIELSQRISQQRTQNTKPNPRVFPTAPSPAPSTPQRSSESSAGQTSAAATPQPAAGIDAATRGSTSDSAPSTSTALAQPRQAPQESVPVNPQPAAPVAEIPAQPTQPARSAEPASPRDEVPGLRGRGPAQSATVEDDEMIRRVIDAWAQAIERKDLAAYRAVKPNLSPDEVRRIQEGFRAVSSQRVTITILGIDHRPPNLAVVRLRRRDTITAGGRQQTTDIEQSMTVARSGAGWTISEIGR